MTDATPDAISILSRELDRRDKHVRRLNSFIVILIALSALSSFFSWRSSTDTKTLLTNGKTTSAVNAKKTASIAEQIKSQTTQIKTLLVTDHAQNVAVQDRQAVTSAVRTRELSDIQTLINNEAAGVKETPVLLKQLENAIAEQDAKAITQAVNAAFASHPSITSKGHS